MIHTDLHELTAYRVHTPRWASVPLSGEGAATHGGRANRPGIGALYLALELETAAKEYQQLSRLMPPGTVVTYQVSVNPVADFRAGYTEQWAPLWEEFMGDWQAQWFDQRIEPPSWVLGDEVIAAGSKGILFASAIRDGGTNLVLFTDQLDDQDAIEVFDPGQTLPKNQDSWR